MQFTVADTNTLSTNSLRLPKELLGPARNRLKHIVCSTLLHAFWTESKVKLLTF